MMVTYFTHNIQKKGQCELITWHNNFGFIHTTLSTQSVNVLKWCYVINSLVTLRCGSNLKSTISDHMLKINFMGNSCDISLGWMPHNTLDDKSVLAQVVAWCCQATSHYMNQCWPRYISKCGITRLQWVNVLSEHFSEHLKTINTLP